MIQTEFWQALYEARDTPWDLGGPSPHFEALLAEDGAAFPPGQLAALGCGRGHDAALFARAGFETIGFDYAPAAVAEAQTRYGAIARFERANVFDLAEPASPWVGQFDYVVEHTCFCAIAPADRPAYVRSAWRLLKPGGRLIGVFWETMRPDGPPYNTTEADLQAHFAAAFTVERLEPRTAAGGRSGVERLAVFCKPVAVTDPALP